MRLDCIENFKPLIGEKIFAIPTGNNARYKAKGYIEEFTVVSVGRKYVKLSGLYSGTNYCPKSGATKDCINSGYVGNAGYMFFKSKIDVDKFKARCQLQNKIDVAARSFNYFSLSDEKLKIMAEILGVKQWND